jgi:hypothetical protein
VRIRSKKQNRRIWNMQPGQKEHVESWKEGVGKESSAIKKSPNTLHWDNQKDALEHLRNCPDSVMARCRV